MLEQIEKLKQEIADQQIEIANLVMERDYLKEKLRKTERDLEIAEDLQDIETFTPDQVAAQFYANNGAGSSMDNTTKADLFFENIHRFTLPQFEQFLKPFLP